MFNQAKHQALLESMHSELGHQIEFRVMEAPAFCSIDLRDRIATAAKELVVACTSPDYHRLSDRALPEKYTVPHESAKPNFAVVDFAVTAENGTYIPKLVELQGFPSLFGYQLFHAEHLRRAYGISAEFTPFFQEMHRDDYLHLFDKVVVNGHHPDNVALLELDPLHQKTLPDFLATQRLIGVGATDVRMVKKVGNILWHERGGALQPIKRVYNRCIVDEMVESGAQIPFDWREELDVEWAGHPNWYFRMSKYSLPFLHHHSVPRTVFISELQSIPSDLDNYVLKPLYAFAGKGVNVNPTAADIEAIPEDQRSVWVLMEKIHYAECLPTPLGANKLEIRCMIMWPDDEASPTATINLVRSGRGAMMGARFNSEAWSGATTALFGPES